MSKKRRLQGQRPVEQGVKPVEQVAKPADGGVEESVSALDEHTELDLDDQDDEDNSDEDLDDDDFLVVDHPEANDGADVPPASASEEVGSVDPIVRRGAIVELDGFTDERHWIHTRLMEIARLLPVAIEKSEGSAKDFLQLLRDHL